MLRRLGLLFKLFFYKVSATEIFIYLMYILFVYTKQIHENERPFRNDSNLQEVQQENRERNPAQRRIPTQMLEMPRMRRNMDTPRRHERIRRIPENKKQRLPSQTKTSRQQLHSIHTKRNSRLRRNKKRRDSKSQHGPAGKGSIIFFKNNKENNQKRIIGGKTK